MWIFNIIKTLLMSCGFCVKFGKRLRRETHYVGKISSSHASRRSFGRWTKEILYRLKSLHGACMRKSTLTERTQTWAWEKNNSSRHIVTWVCIKTCYGILFFSTMETNSIQCIYFCVFLRNKECFREIGINIEQMDNTDIPLVCFFLK